MTHAVTDSERLAIERACEQLVIDSATFNDHKDWVSLAALYAPEAVVTRPTGDQLVSREAIEASYAAGPPDRVTRHFCTNLRVHVDSPTTAHATTVVLIVFGDGTQEPDGPFGVTANERQLIGEFADLFVRTEEGWRIASRHAYMVMHTKETS